jgi:myo-inositol-1(or 4)-monophosphatase
VAAAIQAVTAAGAIQKERLGADIEVRHKGTIDIVTEVDRACEHAIVGILRERFPDHDIVTEETDLGRSGSRFVWYTDPLDGTTNYAHSYPFFCSSVALTVSGEVVAGAVFDPVKDELFTAEKGSGSYVNGRRLRVSSRTELLQSLLVTGFPYDVREDLAGKLRLFSRFMGEARAVRRDGAAALDLCYVAGGRYDGFWEEKLQPWDMMAGILMVHEAGGRTSRFDGTPLGVAADEILATNGGLHGPMLGVLSREAASGPR